MARGRVTGSTSSMSSRSFATNNNGKDRILDRYCKPKSELQTQRSEEALAFLAAFDVNLEDYKKSNRN